MELGAGAGRARPPLGRRQKQPADLAPTPSEAGESRQQMGGAEQRLESLSVLVREQAEQREQEQAQQLGPGDKLESVYMLLAKKDKDLQLAAELGKVLLERNDELSKANERIAEDYSHKLEVSAFYRSVFFPFRSLPLF